MKFKYLLFALILGLILSSCGRNPDVIFINGKIHTLDENNSVVEALAVRNGKIIDIGTTQYISEKYKISNVINLDNKVVLPGFIDCDGSLIEFSKSLAYTVYLNNIKTNSALINIISEKVKDLKDDSWMVFYNLNMENFSDNDKAILGKGLFDEISSKNNIVIIDSLKSYVITNSKVLETLRISKQTQSPENGEIELDEKGELTGVFFGEAQKLISEKIPELTDMQVYDAVIKGTNELLKYGITEVQDRTISKEGVDLLKQLVDSNKMKIKVYGVLTGDDIAFDEFLRKGIIEDYKGMLTVRSVCLDYDGALEIQAAVMRNEYKNDPKTNIPYIDSVKIEEILNKAIDNNFQFRIKVIGDKGLNSILNILSKVLNSKNTENHRTVVEYVEFATISDLEKFRELNLIPSIRPETILDDIEIVPQLIPPDNLRNIGLWKSLLQYSGKIITGSGFPFYNQINPFIQIYYLTQRKQIDTSTQEIPNPEQKLTLIEALKSYTVWAAYSEFEENLKGSLEVDKIADMIVISDDIFNSLPDVLLKVKVLKTIINGEIMYEYMK